MKKRKEKGNLIAKITLGVGLLGLLVMCQPYRMLLFLSAIVLIIAGVVMLFC